MTDFNDEHQFKFDRRDFLKILLLSGSTAIFASLISSLDPYRNRVLAIPGSGPNYYGTDTSWAVDTKGSNASNFPQNFYIGRTGVGEVIYNDSTFYSVAADKAGFSYTHTYWLLKGPYYKWKGSRGYYQYGYDQAVKAREAWFNHYWSSKIGGRTIFADIEEGTSNDPQSDYYDGWRYYSNGSYYVNLANNRLVLEGFLDGIKETFSGENPGIYTRPDLWQSWFGGPNYDPQRDFVTWLAGGACGFSCSPCGTCNTAKVEADSKFSAKRNIGFGKYKTVIWQFFTSLCPAPDCADYNIACQNGHTRFTPISSTIYLPLILNDGTEGMNVLSSYPAPNEEALSTEEGAVQRDSSNAYPVPVSEP